MFVSVCMATYNGERYVREQLESILKELPQSAEIIVADDNSTDKTLQIVEDFKDSRIKILRGESRLGPIYNLERALQNAKGDIIFLADQDDVWLPGKVDSVCKALENSSLVMHDAYILKNGNRERTLSSIRPYKKGVFNNWLKNTYTGCCMAFRRELLKTALPFPKKLPMHDQWLGLVAEKKYDVCYLQTPYIEYRIHESNATQITGKKKSALKRIAWRLSLLRALLGL